MTDSPAATALPDEDLPHFPGAWRRRVRPRRGDGTARKVDLAPGDARRLIKRRLLWLREILALPENAEFEADGLAFLDGEPNPVGAGAVGALLGLKGSWPPIEPRSLIHLLIKVHGLPLAACAAVEFMGLEAWSDPAQDDRHILYWLDDDGIGYYWAKTAGPVTEDLRALVAAAPEAEYAETVAAMAVHRGTVAQALAASLIAPDLTAWTDQLCDVLSRGRPNQYVSTLLLRAITDPEQLRIAGDAAWAGSVTDADDTADLVARIGAHALPILKREIDQWPEASGRKPMYQALAGMPTDEAMAVLIDHLDSPHAVGPAMEAAARYPRRTLRTIAPRVAAADRERRKLLTTVLRSAPILLETALPTMDQATRDAIEPLTRESRRVPDAPTGSLPRLLVEPPWAKPKPKVKPMIVDGLIPLPVNRIFWAAGECERRLPTDHFAYRTMKQWRQEAEQFGDSGFPWPLFFLANAPDELAAPLAAQWEGKDSHPSLAEVQRVLARFGLDVAPQVAALAEADPELRVALLPLASLEAARIAAESLTRRKTARADAVAWLDRHRADAAILLVPDALGKTGKRRRNAETALDYLRAVHGPETLLDAAAQYGEAAVEAIRPLAERDPLEPFGGKVPASGAWAVPAALPQVLVRGRERALPDEAVQRLIEALSVTGLDRPYAGIGVVAEHCDGESLARFSWALFEHWMTAGAPLEDLWAFTQLAWFGDDDTVRALVPIISDWPSHNLHKRAVTGLEVLGAIGSETALRAIHGIAEKVRHDALRWTAAEQIEAVAANLGLNTEQLADRLVPEFGIGEAATLEFDFGPRRFKVGFDEQLRPVITDGEGKPRKRLPKPGARDDAELAEAARKRFSRLKKDVHTVASEQVKRFERDMLDGRVRAMAEFDRHLVRHALMWQLAHRVVWQARLDGEWRAFRLAEDRTCVDIDETELKVPGDAEIRPAHPVYLGDQVGAWAEILADYEIIQPFAQLSRSVAAFTEDELATGRLTRFDGAEVSVGALMGLVDRGWWRDSADDSGLEKGMGTHIHTVGYLEFELDPGLTSGDVHASPRQTLRNVRLVDQERRFGNGYPPPNPAAIDLVAASEILAALARITGVQSGK